jgi:ring-1,2-phenylacetyl-CoA epoxidase subunit PaaC
MKAPIDSPLMADFAARLDEVNAQAEAAPGFLWRLKDDSGNATTISATSPFGAEMLVNVSAWNNTEALRNFVYRNQNHSSALRERGQWFEKMTSPHFAMWWLNDNELPTLSDAKRRIEHLADNGDSPYAFTFKQVFSAEQSIFATAHCQYLLRLADESLIHSQRLSEWCAHGPILEEDMALANVALDSLGQARLIYSHLARNEGRGRDEDELAYFRDDHEFLNASLVELPNSSSFGSRDYAMPIAKLFFHSAYMLLKWEALRSSADTTLAAIASKSIKESRYHFDHASQWVLRFGDGTVESKSRISAALNYLRPYCNELFVDDEIDKCAHTYSIGPLNAMLFTRWEDLIAPILLDATLSSPLTSSFLSRGRTGYHSESLSLLLAEMQSLARQHPGVTW